MVSQRVAAQPSPTVTAKKRERRKGGCAGEIRACGFAAPAEAQTAMGDAAGQLRWCPMAKELRAAIALQRLQRVESGLWRP